MRLLNAQFGIYMHVCVCEYMQYYAHTPAAKIWWSKRSISVSSKSHHRSLNKRDNVLIQEFKGGWVCGRVGGGGGGQGEQCCTNHHA